jgi:hypothetical protein
MLRHRSGILAFAELLGTVALPVPSADTGECPSKTGLAVEGIVTYDGPLPQPVPVQEAQTVRPLTLQR